MEDGSSMVFILANPVTIDFGLVIKIRVIILD